ncbi:hypothetical protein HOK021_71600 [Streptomyces hygroscopicus]|nr:hypothetical protein HOK021_71600 [Streptomyces hygroscopicus]
MHPAGSDAKLKGAGREVVDESIPPTAGPGGASRPGRSPPKWQAVG